jgi:hypothetical protein
MKNLTAHRRHHLLLPVAVLLVSSVSARAEMVDDRAGALGFQTDRVYSSWAEGDHVDTFTGNLVWQIPILSRHVNAALSLAITATYNGKIFRLNPANLCPDCKRRPGNAAF